MTRTDAEIGGGSPRGASAVALDDRSLPSLTREADEFNPIAWGALDLDAARRSVASQIADMSRAHAKAGPGRDEQLLLALVSCIKPTVENFVPHQRLMLALRRTCAPSKSTE